MTSRLGVAVLFGMAILPGRAYAQSSDANAAAHPDTGHLVVNEKAGRPVHAIVDGVDKGPLPWQGDLPSGPHDVSAVGPSLTTPVQHVTIASGGTTVLVLDASASTAHLTVQTNDLQGQILLDGKAVGEGHFTGEVPTGPHDLVVTREGYDRYEEKVSLTDKQVLVKSIALSRAAPKGFALERPLQGIYGGFGVAMLFEPGKAGNEIDTRCPELGATSCSSPAPFGGGLFGYVGYTWNPVGLEVFLAGEYDETTPNANFNGTTLPGENPFVANPPRSEKFTFLRFGGLAAVRARATIQGRYVRASFAAGVGFAYKHMIMDRKTTTTDGSHLTESYVPDGVNYVSPALSMDAAIHWRMGESTALSVGALAWIENAGSNARTPQDSLHCFGSCSLGPATVPLATPSYQMASSTQVFVGPYVGMQFGP